MDARGHSFVITGWARRGRVISPQGDPEDARVASLFGQKRGARIRVEGGGVSAACKCSKYHTSTIPVYTIVRVKSLENRESTRKRKKAVENYHVSGGSSTGFLSDTIKAVPDSQAFPPCP